MRQNRRMAVPAADQATASPAVAGSDLDRLRADIANARLELGATIEALSARMDLKARARDRVASVTGRAAGLARPTRLASPAGGALAVVTVAAGLLAVALLLRRRRRR